MVWEKSGKNRIFSTSVKRQGILTFEIGEYNMCVFSEKSRNFIFG